MIRHTVVFSLKHALGSPAEQSFLAAARQLAAIPGVQKFECLRQIGKRNPFTFGLSMEFADEASYRSYNDHPAHSSFVRDRWLSEVQEFLEIDYQPLQENR